MGILPSLVILGTLALIAQALANSRPSFPERFRERNTASAALAVATLLQAAHFSEELGMGFRIQFPELFGLPPIPVLLFVTLNLACLLLWTYAVLAISTNEKFALSAAWFLVLTGILNGIVHPIISLSSGAYFPGLLTSLPLAIACCWLCISMIKATRPRFPDPVL